MGCTASQVPQEPRVNSSEHQVLISRDLTLGEQPLNLRSREVWVKHESGRCTNCGQFPLGNKFFTALCRSAVLPNNGSMQRASRATVPCDDSFSLIGDSDRCDCSAKFRYELMKDLLRDTPYFGCVVFHPAWLGKVLRELLVTTSDGVAV